MISPELLRRFPFFGSLEDAQLKALAMISEEVEFAKGATLIKADQPAQMLGLLIEGSLDLYYVVEEPSYPQTHREFLVGEVNPGDPFGISALIEPFILISTAKAEQAGRYIAIDAPKLRALCDADPRLAIILMRKVAIAAMERLHFTQVELAAARA